MIAMIAPVRLACTSLSRWRSLALPATLALVLLIGCAPTIEPTPTPPTHLPTPVSGRGAAPRTPVTPTPGMAFQRVETAAAPAELSLEARTRLDRARQRLQLGNLADALREYRDLDATNQATPEILLELGQAELASGEYEAARATLDRLLGLDLDETSRRRARLLRGVVALRLANWQDALDQLDVAAAPDGLADLVALRRAEALVRTESPDAARAELARDELRRSTNRLILDEAGQLAETIGDLALAAQFYRRASEYPGLTVDRTRLIESAAMAFESAGDVEAAVEQYRRLIEDYGWTAAGVRAGERLYALDRLSSYHAGLLGVQTGQLAIAREGFSAAAEGGPNAEAARSWLRWLDERADWVATVEDGTAAAYQWFRSIYPEGTNAVEAQFREGLIYYENGWIEDALEVWATIPSGAGADDRARLHFWSAKALAALGREDEARTAFQAAVAQGLSHYYAIRARDLLNGLHGWPIGAAVPAADPEAERAEVERWLAGWAGSEAPTSNERIRRGLGLLALGFLPEATAEFNGLIAETDDGRLLYQIAETLAEQGLWSAASTAATRLALISPEKSVPRAPLAVQRLAYPPAFWELVRAEAERHGIDPLLLLALISQESNYDRFAVSIAGARGLTQVMPATGEAIAAALGKPSFTPDDLFRPAVAIEFGAAYLAGQLIRFGNDPFLAFAAYNAGAGPVPRWAADDPDLFVERIDYPETRRFVQSIYRHYAVYRTVGGG